MFAFSAEVDVSQIESALKETVLHSSRTIPEIINGTCLFVARGAVAQTFAANKMEIRKDRLKGSNINAKAPVQAIFVNIARHKKGLPGLNGPKMAAAVEKGINKAVAYAQYTRSQWLTPAKILSPYVKSKAGSPKLPSGVRVKGTHHGGALAATPNSNLQAEGAIWITMDPKHNAGHVQQIVTKGLQESVNAEAQDKMEHNLERMMKEGVVKLWS